MKLFKLLVLCCWVLACGGEPLTEEEMADELGQAEQGVATYGSYGLNLGQAAPNEGSQCSASGSTANCLLPGSKQKRYRCNTGTLSGSDLSTCTTIVDQEVQAFINQFGVNWAFGRVSQGANVTIDKVALAGGQPTNDIRPYVQIGNGGCGAVLAENPSVTGSFKQCSNTTCGIDFAKIASAFPNASDRLRVTAHALGMCFAASVGVGYTTAVTDRKNSVSITTSAAKSLTLRASDACNVNNYGVTDATLVWKQTCP